MTGAVKRDKKHGPCPKNILKEENLKVGKGVNHTSKMVQITLGIPLACVDSWTYNHHPITETHRSDSPKLMKMLEKPWHFKFV